MGEGGGFICSACLLVEVNSAVKTRNEICRVFIVSRCGACIVLERGNAQLRGSAVMIMEKFGVARRGRLLSSELVLVW